MTAGKNPPAVFTGYSGHTAMLTRRELSQPKSTHYSRSGITHQPHRPQHPPCGRCAPLRGASLPGLPAQTCAGQAPTNVPGLTPTTRQCGRGREQAPGPHTAGRPGNDKVKGGGGTRRGTLPHSPRDSPPGSPAPPLPPLRAHPRPRLRRGKANTRLNQDGQAGRPTPGLSGQLTRRSQCSRRSTHAPGRCVAVRRIAIDLGR